jgi:hypothetical protein
MLVVVSAMAVLVRQLGLQAWVGARLKKSCVKASTLSVKHKETFVAAQGLCPAARLPIGP